MYRKSFPKCEVNGDQTPVPYGHMFSRGAVPKKCSTCSHLFEGGCMRAIDTIEDFLRLDYPACKVNGATTPTKMEVINNDTVYVPQKCSQCTFLSKNEIRGYFCSNEKEIWQDFPRDLDWGDWQPDYPLIGIRKIKVGKYSDVDLGPAVVNKELVNLLMANENTKALKLYRVLNKIETIKEARITIELLKKKLENR